MLFYIIAGAIGILCLVVFLIINGAQKDVKNKRVILFNLLFAVIISAFGCFGLISKIEESVWWFLVLQLTFLIIGSIFYSLLGKNFFGELKSPIVSQVLLLLSNISLGFLGFSLVFNFFQEDGLAFNFGLSILVFSIPYAFMSTFKLLTSIPQEIYKIWYYPVDMDEPDFDKIDLNNIYLLELEFSKSPNDVALKNYKARAPVDMIFGVWYRSFINNYNYKFEEDPVQFLDSNKRPHGWMFFTKPQSFWETKQFIDPDLTIKKNKLTEKTVIVAKRVEVQE